MDDLISRQDSIRSVTTRDGCGRCEKAIKNIPSVDALKVVRCKDCDYWYERKGEMYCGEMYFNQDDPDFYCGYAERKTDG